MSVGDSANVFILTHALGREEWLVLSCGIPSIPLKILVFGRWETVEGCCLSFLRTSQRCFN